MLTALFNDPILLAAPLIYGVLTVVRKSRRHMLLAAGAWIYLAYVIYIGGDFMLGRHLTVPFFASVSGIMILIGEEAREGRIRTLMTGITMIAAACVVFALSFGTIEGKRYLWAGDKYLMQCMDVADERGYYIPTTGFLAYLQTKDGDYEGGVTKTFNTVEVDEMLTREQPGGELLRGASGILVYYYLEGVHVYDAYGLADAFLARLPAVYDEHWRIGHMQREIPAGYEETVVTGENCIEDANLHQFYDALSIVIKGDLWSWERFKMIWRMNTGYYNKLLGY